LCVISVMHLMLYRHKMHNTAKLFQLLEIKNTGNYEFIELGKSHFYIMC
jgi:hypothetical protein